MTPKTEFPIHMTAKELADLQDGMQKAIRWISAQERALEEIIGQLNLYRASFGEQPLDAQHIVMKHMEGRK